MSDKRAGNSTQLYTKAETVEQLINEIQQLKFNESLTISDETVACLGAHAKLTERAKSMENKQFDALVKANQQSKVSIRELHERLHRMRDWQIDGDTALREEAEHLSKYFSLIAIGISWATVAAAFLAHLMLSH